MLNHKGTVTINTQRLTLRRFTAADAEDMFKNWASDERVVTYLSWHPHASVPQTAEKIGEWISEYSNPATYNWALEYDGQVIGNIRIFIVSEAAEIAEIGYCMGYAWWNLGIMTEAVRAVRDFLFDEIGFNRLCIKHAVINPGSGRVAQKCGFTYEGIRREGYRISNGKFIDAICYAMLKSDRELKRRNAEYKVQDAVTIRRGAKKDIPRLLELLGQIIKLHHYGRPDLFKVNSKYAEHDLISLLSKPDHPIWVAETADADGKKSVKGYIFCIVKHSRDIPQFNDFTTLYVDDLCVDESIRGMGIGRALFDAAKKYAIEIGAHNIDLNVWEFNNRAISFYRSLGMTTERRHMELVLGPDDK